MKTGIVFDEEPTKQCLKLPWDNQFSQFASKSPINVIDERVHIAADGLAII